MRPPQRRRAALRHADMVKQALLHERREHARRVLDGVVVVHARALEEVDALEPAERGLDRCRAAPEVFWSVRTGLSLNTRMRDYSGGRERTMSWAEAAFRGFRP